MPQREINFFERACADLVKAAGEKRMRDTWGRDEEARRVLDLLREKRSVLLVGPPGAGKTAIVNRVAALIAAEKPAFPNGLYSVGSAAIIATPQGYIGQ